MTRYSYKHFEMSFFLEKNGKKLIFGKKNYTFAIIRKSIGFATELTKSV